MKKAVYSLPSYPTTTYQTTRGVSVAFVFFWVFSAKLFRLQREAPQDKLFQERTIAHTRRVFHRNKKTHGGSESRDKLFLLQCIFPVSTEDDQSILAKVRYKNTKKINYALPTQRV